MTDKKSGDEPAASGPTGTPSHQPQATDAQRQAQLAARIDQLQRAAEYSSELPNIERANWRIFDSQQRKYDRQIAEAPDGEISDKLRQQKQMHAEGFLEYLDRTIADNLGRHGESWFNRAAEEQPAGLTSPLFQDNAGDPELQAIMDGLYARLASFQEQAESHGINMLTTSEFLDLATRPPTRDNLAALCDFGQSLMTDIIQHGTSGTAPDAAKLWRDAAVLRSFAAEIRADVQRRPEASQLDAEQHPQLVNRITPGDFIDARKHPGTHVANDRQPTPAADGSGATLVADFGTISPDLLAADVRAASGANPGVPGTTDRAADEIGSLAADLKGAERDAFEHANKRDGGQGHDTPPGLRPPTGRGR